MTARKWLAWAIGLLAALMLTAAPAAAQPSPVEQRAQDVVRMLRGEVQPDAVFAPVFLAQVPAAQVNAISGQLRSQYGAVRGLEGVETQSPTAGLIRIDYERAVVRMNLSVDPQPPHLIQGLLITGADMRGDSWDKLVGELRALPGEVSFAAYRLGDAGLQPLAAHQPDKALAIGSAFKLFILAEISRQVQAGERNWADVVPLDRRSLPSGIMQDWPAGAPVTVHTLAALMISRSDNTATDMLLHLAGRENVERMMERIGIADPARNRPFLSTLEAFALKSLGEAEFEAWRTADEAGRRRILADRIAAIPADRIDVARFTGAPARIDTVEWYASAEDLARTMDWLRRNGDESARAILAISPGMPAATARELGYAGFKGGSEPGVINLTYLVRNQAGQWHAIVGTWNNPAAAVEDSRFVGLLGRAIQLVR